MVPHMEPNRPVLTYFKLKSNSMTVKSVLCFKSVMFIWYLISSAHLLLVSVIKALNQTFEAVLLVFIGYNL